MNFKGIRYDSTSFNRIVADELYLVTLVLSLFCDIVLYTSFKQTAPPGISYFVLLSRALFVPCLFEKVYREGNRLAESVCFENRWGAQFACKRLNFIANM